VGDKEVVDVTPSAAGGADGTIDDGTGVEMDVMDDNVGTAITCVASGTTASGTSHDATNSEDGTLFAIGVDVEIDDEEDSGCEELCPLDVAMTEIIDDDG
jgi:hypothetical protein